MPMRSIKAYTILNNCQVGAERFQVLTCKIIEKERLDPYHVKIVWDNLTEQEFKTVVKRIGTRKKVHIVRRKKNEI